MKTTISHYLIGSAAEIIREHSRNARLAAAVEIESELKEKHPQGFRPDEIDWDIHKVLKVALEENEDLRVILDHEGVPFHYSAEYLSETYAKILVTRGSPIRLIAETVREHAALYPRPVPLDMFEDPPFDLQPDGMKRALDIMAKLDQFKDIAFTKTSMGTVYLYSTRYIDHEYATMLAERDDVELLESP